MKPSAEDLLGYLLGALDPDEHRRVDRAVAERPELQAELVLIRERLQPLARLEEVRALSATAEDQFPSGLARRACEWVARHSRTGSAPEEKLQGPNVQAPDKVAIETSTEDQATHLVNSLENAENSLKSLANACSDGAVSLGNVVSQGNVVSLGTAMDAGSIGVATRTLSARPVGLKLSGAWQVQDFIVVAAVAMLAVSMVAPALLASRNQARLAACQDNLRRIGMGLFNYAEAHQNRLVPIARTGPLNVAGAYAPVLKSGQFVEDDRVFYCSAAVQQNLSQVGTIPNLAELEKAYRENSQQLTELQALMGGSYGYSLGHYEDDKYVGPMNLGRSFRVIMADAPNYALASRASANHGGSGLNMLFEDGSVRFSETASAGAAGDSIFVNRNGLVAAGIDVQDSVIGASNASAWISSNLYQN